MPVYTIRVTEETHAALVAFFNGFKDFMDNREGDVSSARRSPSPDSITDGAMVLSSSALVQDLETAKRDIGEVLGIAASMGVDIERLQGMAEKLDGSEKKWDELKEQFLAEVVKWRRVQRDLDELKESMKNLNAAFLCAGIGLGFAVIYDVLMRFGHDIVTIFVALTFVAAVISLLGLRLPSSWA